MPNNVQVTSIAEIYDEWMLTLPAEQVYDLDQMVAKLSDRSSYIKNLGIKGAKELVLRLILFVNKSQ